MFSTGWHVFTKPVGQVASVQAMADDELELLGEDGELEGVLEVAEEDGGDDGVDDGGELGLLETED